MGNLHENEWTALLNVRLFVCMCVCVLNGGVWGSWDPLSQTCTDLSNQTGIKGQGGGVEGMGALECVSVCVLICMCMYVSSWLHLCVCVC